MDVTARIRNISSNSTDTVRTNTAEFEIDSTSGVITMRGLQGIAPNASLGPRPAGTAQILGLSPGQIVYGSNPTSVPTQTIFAPIGGMGSFGLEMAYDWHPQASPSTPGAVLVATVSMGVDELVFTPNTLGGYDWLAL